MSCLSEGRWALLNPSMFACIVLRVEWLPTLRNFLSTSEAFRDVAMSWASVRRKERRLVEMTPCSYVWIIVAKVGACKGSKLITEMWIDSDEFGLGVSYHALASKCQQHQGIQILISKRIFSMS
eukprot:454290-Pelagomonas_calceolata.AAC.1